MKEIPEELLKHIEDEAVKFGNENVGVPENSSHYEFLLAKIKYSFTKGAKFSLSLSPSSGEGDLLASGKALSEVRCDAPFDSNNSIEQQKK